MKCPFGGRLDIYLQQTWSDAQTKAEDASAEDATAIAITLGTLGTVAMNFNFP